MSGLPEFLLARIAEDWHDAMVGWRWKALPAGEYARLQARVLAECEAKRRIVEAYREERNRRDAYQATDPKRESLGQAYYRHSSAARCRGLEIAVDALALPYADHPDYREEWRP